MYPLSGVQALMQRKKKNAKNVSSAENHKVLAKMLELLHEEVAISREVASRFKVLAHVERTPPIASFELDELARGVLSRNGAGRAACVRST